MSRTISASLVPCLRPAADDDILWQTDLSETLQPLLSKRHQQVPWIVIKEISTVQPCEDLVDMTLLAKVIGKKNRLGKYDPYLLNRARFYADKYTAVATANVPALFMNRAALKLANLDILCRPPLISAHQTTANTAVHPSDNHRLLTPPPTHNQFVFFDLCGGPGGFSEYIFWRRERDMQHSTIKQCTFGYGVTLTKSVDISHRLPTFRMDRLKPQIANSDYYTAYFKKVLGPRGTGDIYDPGVRRCLCREALEIQKKGGHVSLITADGAIDVSGQENRQEYLMQPLILAQASIALQLLSDGGDLVLKLFDICTVDTATLVLFVASCFKQFAIIKPKLSRAANSERYLICRGFQSNTQLTIICTLHLNQAYNQWFNATRLPAKVVQILPLEQLKMMTGFVHYLKNTNNHILSKQSKALNKLIHYYHYPQYYLSAKNRDKQNRLVQRMMEQLRIPYRCNITTLKKLRRFCELKQQSKEQRVSGSNE